MAKNDRIPAWTPDEQAIAHANVTALMSKRDLTDFDDLHRWSVAETDEFWREVIDELAIAFIVPPSGMRGSDDVEDPRWLSGAIFNIVASCLDHDPAATAIVHGGPDRFETISVGSLSERVAAFAGGFKAAGFAPGDAVAIVMPMNVEAVVAYLGIIAAGGVVVSIADSFAPDEIRTRLDITSPVAVVTQTQAIRGGKTLPMYRKCVEAGATHCIVVDADGGEALRARDVWWDHFIVRGEPFEPLPTPASTHINVLFSSGTTGDPKAIPWNQTTPIKAAMDARYHQDVHTGDVVAWPTNLGWMMGPWLIFGALLNEATLALYDDAPTTRGFVEFVERAGVTMLGLVPSIVASWRASGTLRRGDWTSVRVLSSTGEASNPDDYRWLMETVSGVPVIEYCGGTEIGGGYVTSTVLHPCVPARFTTPTLGLDLVLIDETGYPADSGEVFLVPPSIGLSSELLNLDHHEVYFEGVPDIGRPLRRHGDQLERDADGYLRALGRVDDTMNLGGIKVSSADLEAAASGVEGVAEVAAVAVRPPDGGPDRLIVFVVPEPAATLDLDHVRAEMQARIRTVLNPLFKVNEVIAIPELPRTASHKVMRRTLRSGVLRDGTGA